MTRARTSSSRFASRGHSTRGSYRQRALALGWCVAQRTVREPRGPYVRHISYEHEVMAMQQRIFATRKPQRRAVRTAECEAMTAFPAVHAPAGAGDDLDELLAAIDAVL